MSGSPCPTGLRVTTLVRLSSLALRNIMMSICLQSMVDELMVKKSGGSIQGKVQRWLCSPLPFVLGLTLLRGRGGSGFPWE